MVAAVVMWSPPSAVATSAVEISSGREHTCAITGDGGVRCWGYNTNGQLGDGTTTTRRTPVDVVGLTAGAAQVSAGLHHTCAVTTDGAVRCWGDNHIGQLGDGTTEERHTPVDVVGLSDVAAVTAGGTFTCALTTDGGVGCWGFNSYGQLGDGTEVSSPTPVGVAGLSSGVLSVSAGWSHACAVTDDGAAKCWGYNNHGLLGDGTTMDRLIPVDVSGLSSGATAISANETRTCAIVDGGVKCWGEDRLVPVDVTALASGVTAVSVGAGHSCVIVGTGAMCWGSGREGQLGAGRTFQASEPVTVWGLSSGVESISAGGAHTCAVTTTGAGRCWGWDEHGQVGDGSRVDKFIPFAPWGFSGNEPITYQADLQIAGASRRFVGDGVYGETGERQTRRATVQPGGTAVFHLRVQNDGTVPDTLAWYQRKPAGLFRITYLRSARWSSVHPLNWSTDPVPVGGFLKVRLKIVASAIAPSGAQVTVLLQAASTGDSSKGDAVRAIVTVGE